MSTLRLDNRPISVGMVPSIAALYIVSSPVRTEAFVRSARGQNLNAAPPKWHLRKLESSPISVGSVPFKRDESLESEKISTQIKSCDTHVSDSV